MQRCRIVFKQDGVPQNTKVKLKNCSTVIQEFVAEWKKEVESGGVAASMLARDPKRVPPFLSDLSLRFDPRTRKVWVAEREDEFETHTTGSEWDSMIEMDSGACDYYDV
jgi:hypothetical protein